jgi:hypothetical protein
MGWAAFWAIFSQTHPVTLPSDERWRNRFVMQRKSVPFMFSMN